VRISPNLLLVSKAEYLPDIYYRRSVKTNHYNLLGFGRTPSVFHSISHADHTQRRRMVASAYNFSGQKGVEKVVDRRVELWITKLKELSVSNANQNSKEIEGGAEPMIEFASWAKFLTLDIIGEVGFGKHLKCVETGSDTERLDKGFRAGLFAFGFVTRMHVVAEWVNWSFIGRVLEWQVSRDNTVGILMRFVRKVLKERLCVSELVEGDKNRVRVEKINDMLQRYVLCFGSKEVTS